MANSPARAVDVGSIIAGTYKIEALIGTGGMGAVFLASHARLPGKKVAIKLLHAELREDEVLARFKREAQIASQLDHPNIVGVHDFNVTEDGTPYLVLEYLQGESLAQRLRQGPIAPDRVASIVRQVGSALAAAHRAGIVHRDLKPANIFLVPTEVDGRPVEVAKILDFGISKMLYSSTVKTQESTLLGTPAYMAPEQAKGDHANVDARTDVFALGVIVYEMLAGHPPFAGANIPEVVFKVVYEPPPPLAQQAPNAPRTMTAAVEQAMAKAQRDRFTSVSAFVEALTGTPVTVRSPVPDNMAQEALAQTMHSGDFGSAPSQRAGVATDKTVASGADVVPPPHEPSASPRQGEPSAAAVPRPASRRRGVLFAVVGLVVVAAVVIGILATRRTKTAGHADAGIAASADARANVPKEPNGLDAAALAADAAMLANHSDDAATVADVDAMVAAGDAHPAVATTPRDAGAVRAPSDARRASPPVEEDEPDDPAGAVARAEAALRAGKYDQAEQLANSVINANGGMLPRQIARAHAIRGAVYCLRDSNLERARIDLAQIPRQFHRMRDLVSASCRGVGSL